MAKFIKAGLIFICVMAAGSGGMRCPAEEAGEIVQVAAYSPSNDAVYSGGSPRPAPGSKGTVIELSCPWGSDYRTLTSGKGEGWGDQCGADGLKCCTPPSCPAGWTDAGTFPVSDWGACPGNNGCYWYSPYHKEAHPVVGGRVVRVCVRN